MSSTGRGPASGRGRSRLRLVTSSPAEPSSGSDDLLDPAVRRFSGRDPEQERPRVPPARRVPPRGAPARRPPVRRDPDPVEDDWFDDYTDAEVDGVETITGPRAAPGSVPARGGRRTSAGGTSAGGTSARGRSADRGRSAERAGSSARGASSARSGAAGTGRQPARSTARGTAGASRTRPVRGAPVRGAARSRTGSAGRRPPARRGLDGSATRAPRPFVLASPRRRIRASVVLMVAVLVVIAGRLAQLQGFGSSAYAEAAHQQVLRKSVLPADRGMITDRHGYPLARDIEQRAVYADPFVMSEAEILTAARKLAPVIGRSENELRKLMTTNRKARFVYLGRGFERSVGDEVTGLGLSGIGVLDERGRSYPAGTLGANFVGFTSRGDNDVLDGRAGLELAYDDVLHGTNGRRQIEADPSGREIPSAQSMEKEPVDGSTLRLTIEKDIQWEAQRAIAEAVRDSEADGGTIVVMQPKTGDLLALADAPQYDPNNITERDQDAIGNRSTGQAFEPGSVNKVITMAAALDRSLIDATTPITVPSSIERGGVRINDSEPHGTEHLTAAGVLARSSNIGTVQIAERVGSANLEEMMRAFGLGEKTELDFPGETAGILPAASDWSGSQAATIAYGQGMSATAIQMASVYATVANGGLRVAPRLVDAIIGPDGVAQETAREPERRVISTETATTLTRMLEEVATDQGTAPAAEVTGYRVAGKTGTAKRYDAASGGYKGYVSSFIGFAPADDPQIVVEVVLDNPQKAYYGGEVAAPVFSKVMSFALTTLGVPPPGTRPEPLVLDLDR
ncbi:peptidoglycan glycosyltransferase [Frankia sp. CcI49]|uniref:peptidoglycan D,D-transpeptidase FtsI family protein n=1 Tax=Frankia sp. CcI49 TaxID=1745382 RepID=UPI00097848C5|nr:penicillin-binding protein 2 [Frankia sp. CcI49]ONH62265.1 peptidoglycan glycosyltransferase [Frankia sp. CcI49]